MSGGSMDYLSYKVEEANFREDTPERRAFRNHLQLVATALHAIEWADSGDTLPGEHDTPAILACLAPGAVLASEVTRAEAVMRDLQRVLDAAREALEAQGAG